MELDFAAGEIIAGVKAAGAAENTITFFTSGECPEHPTMARLWRQPACRSSDSCRCADNGPWLTMRLAGGSAGLLRDGKSTTWEGGIREPGIVHWPGKIKPGTTPCIINLSRICFFLLPSAPNYRSTVATCVCPTS